MENKKNNVILTTLFILFTLGLFACEQNVGPASIRIENASDYDFKRIMVRSNSEELYYGNMKSGELSLYKTFRNPYRSAHIELLIGNDKFVFQPVDFIGGEGLGGGKYTYRLSIGDFGQKRLRLDFIRD